MVNDVQMWHLMQPDVRIQFVYIALYIIIYCCSKANNSSAKILHQNCISE